MSFECPHLSPPSCLPLSVSCALILVPSTYLQHTVLPLQGRPVMGSSTRSTPPAGTRDICRFTSFRSVLRRRRLRVHLSSSFPECASLFLFGIDHHLTYSIFYLFVYCLFSPVGCKFHGIRDFRLFCQLHYPWNLEQGLVHGDVK